MMSTLCYSIVLMEMLYGTLPFVQMVLLAHPVYMPMGGNIYAHPFRTHPLTCATVSQWLLERYAPPMLIQQELLPSQLVA